MNANFAKLVALSSLTTAFLLGTTACVMETPAPDGVVTGGFELKGVTADAQGRLHFDTAETFFGTFEALGKMTPQEIEAWENGLGFISQNREFDRIMREVMMAPDEVTADAILKQHEDLIEVSGDEVELRIVGYTSVVGRDGIYYVGDTVHKVLPDVVISSADGRIESIEAEIASLGEIGTALLGPMTTPAEGLRIVRYRGGNLDHLQASDQGCTDYKSAFYQSSDRKIDLDIWTWKAYCATCCGQYYHQVQAAARLRGYKKNWLGNWSSSYNTTMEAQNIEFQVQAPKVYGYNGITSLFNYEPQVRTLTYTSSGGTEWQTWNFASWTLGNQVQNSDIQEPYFDKVKGQGKSRGTGADGWAEICCGYAGGCYFPPVCVPRTSCYSGECGYVGNGCGGTLYCGSCGGSGSGGGSCDPNAAKGGGNSLLKECPILAD